MIDISLLKSIAEGLKKNIDALFGFACLVFCAGFLAKGLNEWLSLAVPFMVYIVYSANQRARIKGKLDQAKLDFESAKEQNRVQLEKRKQKLLK